MKVAAFGLGLVLLVLPFAAQSDENLVAKREACRQQARMRIAPKGKIGVDDFRRIIERRAAHVRDCMSRPFVVQNEPPIAPKKALDATSLRPEPVTGSVRKKPSAAMKSTGSRKRQARSVRSLKGRNAGAKHRIRLFRTGR